MGTAVQSVIAPRVLGPRGIRGWNLLENVQANFRKIDVFPLLEDLARSRWLGRSERRLSAGESGRGGSQRTLGNQVV